MEPKFKCSYGKKSRRTTNLTWKPWLLLSYLILKKWSCRFWNNISWPVWLSRIVKFHINTHKSEFTCRVCHGYRPCGLCGLCGPCHHVGSRPSLNSLWRSAQAGRIQSSPSFDHPCNGLCRPCSRLHVQACPSQTQRSCPCRKAPCRSRPWARPNDKCNVFSLIRPRLAQFKVARLLQRHARLRTPGRHTPVRNPCLSVRSVRAGRIFRSSPRCRAAWFRPLNFRCTARSLAFCSCY